MKPLDTIRAIGRPIAYHAALARHVGGVATAIFLGQLMYWDEKSTDERGVHKESKQWEDETGLSYREQATARKKLRDLGLLIETPERLKHRIFYKLDREAFNAWIESVSEGSEPENGELREAQLPNDENAFGGQHIPQSGDDAKRSSLIGKTTTEITTKTTNGLLPGSAGQADSGSQSLFEVFWLAYPKKRAKGQAERAFAKINPDRQLMVKILSGIKRAKASRDWRKDGGTYIPHPSTWLNAKGWEDEYDVDAPEGNSLFEQNMAAAAQAKAMIFGGGNAAV